MSDIGNRTVFSANLKKYMDCSGKTRNEICQALGIKYSTFTEWINGIKYPRIDKIELLANYFGIKKSDLIERKEQPAETEGLSELAMQIARLVDRLPPESRRLLLLQVQALAQAESNQAAPEESPK